MAASCKSPTSTCRVRAACAMSCSSSSATTPVRARSRTRFSPASFADFAGRRALFVIDIEGNEVGLFKGAADADLAPFDFVVECHDAAPGKVSAALLERLKRTHAARLVAHALPSLALPSLL